MKQYLVLIPISVFIFSCIKSDVRNYAGVVVDTSGTPIANVMVILNYRQGASSFSDGGEAITTLDVTESDGTFSSKFTLRKKEYINHITFKSPAPNPKNISTRDYNSASATDIRFVIK